MGQVAASSDSTALCHLPHGTTTSTTHVGAGSAHKKIQPHLLLLALGDQALGDTHAVQHDVDALLEGVGQLPIALLQVSLL